MRTRIGLTALWMVLAAGVAHGQTMEVVPRNTFLVAANNAPTNIKARARFICDGVDDQVQIQAAIDALPYSINQAEGGTIQLSPGRYTISAPIRITRPHCTIQGDGVASTVVYLANNSNTDGFRLTHTVAASGWWTIRDMTLYGNKANNIAGVGIRSDLSYGTKHFNGNTITADTNGSTSVLTDIADTSIFQVGSTVKVSAGMPSSSVYYGVTAVGANSITLGSNNSTSAQNDVTLTVGGHNFDIRLEHIFVWQWAEDGIRLSNTWGGVLSHVVSEFNAGDGLRIGASTASSIEGPKILGSKFIANRGHGVYLGPYSRGTSIVATDLAGGTGKAGLYILGSNENLIQGCKFLSNGVGTPGAKEDRPSAGAMVSNYNAGTEASTSWVYSLRNVINGNHFEDSISFSTTTCNTLMDAGFASGNAIITNIASTAQLQNGSLVQISNGMANSTTAYIVDNLNTGAGTCSLRHPSTMLMVNASSNQTGVTMRPVHRDIFITNAQDTLINNNVLKLVNDGTNHKALQDNDGRSTVGMNWGALGQNAGVVSKAGSGTAALAITHNMAPDMPFWSSFGSFAVTPGNAATAALANNYYISAVTNTVLTLTLSSGTWDSGTTYKFFVLGQFPNFNYDMTP